jgi:hypothetical protein
MGDGNMARDKTIITLEITSFGGISIGAEHYYGALYGYTGDEFKKVELNHPMTIEQARNLTKKDFESRGLVADFLVYHSGTMTNRFDCRDDVRYEAVAQYKKHYPDATKLIEGSFGSYERKKVLDPEGMDDIVV